MCLIGGRVGKSHSGIYSAMRDLDGQVKTDGPKTAGRTVKPWLVSKKHGEAANVVELGGDEESMGFVEEAGMMFEVF